jgi:ribosomal protein L40E
MKTCTKCGRQNPDDCTWCPECGTAPRLRTASPEELLDRVIDRKSFVEFVTALAEERGEAEQMERDEPVRYQLGGAHNWQNGSISSFLYASLAYFDSKPFHEPESAPSWKMLADILYYGKIYE